MDFLFGWASQLPNSLFSQCCWLPRCVRVREHGSNILKDYHIRPSTATTVYEPLMRGRALYRVFHVLLSLSLIIIHTYTLSTFVTLPICFDALVEQI